MASVDPIPGREIDDVRVELNRNSNKISFIVTYLTKAGAPAEWVSTGPVVTKSSFNPFGQTDKLDKKPNPTAEYDIKIDKVGTMLQCTTVSGVGADDKMNKEAQRLIHDLFRGQLQDEANKMTPQEQVALTKAKIQLAFEVQEAFANKTLTVDEDAQQIAKINAVARRKIAEIVLDEVYAKYGSRDQKMVDRENSKLGKQIKLVLTGVTDRDESLKKIANLITKPSQPWIPRAWVNEQIEAYKSSKATTKELKAFVSGFQFGAKSLFYFLTSSANDILRVCEPTDQVWDLPKNNPWSRIAPYVPQKDGVPIPDTAPHKHYRPEKPKIMYYNKAKKDFVWDLKNPATFHMLYGGAIVEVFLKVAAYAGSTDVQHKMEMDTIIVQRTYDIGGRTVCNTPKGRNRLKGSDDEEEPEEPPKQPAAAAKTRNKLAASDEEVSELEDDNSDEEYRLKAEAAAAAANKKKSAAPAAKKAPAPLPPAKKPVKKVVEEEEENEEEAEVAADDDGEAMDEDAPEEDPVESPAKKPTAKKTTPAAAKPVPPTTQTKAAAAVKPKPAQSKPKPKPADEEEEEEEAEAGEEAGEEEEGGEEEEDVPPPPPPPKKVAANKKPTTTPAAKKRPVPIDDDAEQEDAVEPEPPVKPAKKVAKKRVIKSAETVESDEE